MTKTNLVTVEQAAAYLGLKPATIRSWILRKRLLAYVKIGRAVRIRITDLDALIEQGSVPARPNSQQRKPSSSNQAGSIPAK